MSDMVVSFDDGTFVFGEQILSVAIRSDLVPVPLTAEIVFRSNDDLMQKMKSGERFRVGESADYFVSVFTEKVHVNGVQDGVKLNEFKVIAFLDAVKEIAFTASRATCLEKTSILSIYQACGCKFAGDSDVPVAKFANFAGQVPSFMMMRCLQESAAVITYKNGKLTALSLRNLNDKIADYIIPSLDNTRTESGFLERHEIPIFATPDPSGELVFGNQTSKTRSAKIVPKMDKLTLSNLSYVLVNRRTAKISLNQSIIAGDCVQLDDAKYIVITALHFSELSGKNVDAYTRLWLGEISKT
jgi:hypothetical protein